MIEREIEAYLSRAMQLGRSKPEQCCPMLLRRKIDGGKKKLREKMYERICGESLQNIMSAMWGQAIAQVHCGPPRVPIVKSANIVSTQ